jgi:hypothetical protein
VITLVTDAGIPAALHATWHRRGFEILIAENTAGSGDDKGEKAEAETEAKA